MGTDRHVVLADAVSLAITAVQFTIPSYLAIC
jgi:hypothetical protein